MTAAPQSQYQHSAEWYDRIYATMGKDYAGEAQIIDGVIRTHYPRAQSLLDVGCGTGHHLQAFGELFDEVAGVDLDPSFVAAARSRCAGARVTVGDMCTFQLQRRFDAVTCLFAAVAHAGSADNLNAAIANMAAHLSPGGVLVIEPWVAPDKWRDGHYGVEVAEGKDSTLVRTNHASSEGEVSVVNFGWTEVGTRGTTQLLEQLRLTRFTNDQYATAFKHAGVAATFDERGCNDNGRGMWVGVLGAT